MFNNKLYASLDAINIAFNCSYIINSETKTTRIDTLSYLYQKYENNYKKAGYSLSTIQEETSERETKEVQKDQSFRNQKALVYNMAIVNRNKKFGVINTTKGTTLIGTKYDNIDYVEERQEFIVTSGGKQGILSNTGETQIDIDYDSIELLDGKSNYYLVGKNSKYGIMKSGEEIVVPIEFSKISYKLIKDKKVYSLQKENEIITLEDYLR